MVLVQFTQFRADTGNVLIHLASEIGKALIHLRAQAANSLEYNNRKNSNILEMFIKMMIDSKAGLFHKPKSIQKKPPPATPIYISRVYLQFFMGFGFLAFMPGQWVWETPLCSGVDLSHESQDNYTIFSNRRPANQPSKRQNTPFPSHNYYDPTGFMQPPVHSPRLMMT